jgi:hypothetical protein
MHVNVFLENGLPGFVALASVTILRNLFFVMCKALTRFIFERVSNPWEIGNSVLSESALEDVRLPAFV